MLSKLASAAVVDADAFTLPGAVISIPAQQAGAGSPAVRKEALGASLSAASLGTACAFGGFLFAAVARKSGVARRGRCSGQTRACALSGEEFLAGQKVVIVGHPAMHGKAGEIVAPDASGSFKVLFESGSIFSIAADMIQDAATQAAAQAVAAPAPVMPAPVSAAAPSPAPSPAPAPAPAPAPVPAVAAPAVAATEEAELEFTPGQRVVIVGHPVMAGKQGDVVGPAVGNAFAVRFESGSVFNIATDQLQDAAVPVPAAPQPVAATQTAATPVAARATPAQDDDDELEFTPGQRVVVNGPPAMAGKQGAIVGAALGNTFAVQFDSGSIFNIATESIQDAAAPAPVAPASAATAPVTSYAPASAAQDDEELEFTPGQQVVLIGPSAMAGKKGSIMGPAVGNAFEVRFESGSVFNISTENIQDAAAPAPSVTASHASVTPTKAAIASATQDDDQLEFTPGQRVVVKGPPAMAGKKGVVVGPALDNTFAVRFDSGSVFNISAENIQDAAAPAPAVTASSASVTPAPQAVVSSAAQCDKELEFTPGQTVALLGPPAMFGKRATVVGPALDNTFKVRLKSGSVFNIKTDNLQDAAMPMPAAPVTPPPAPVPVAAVPAASPEAEVEFSPGQKVVMLSPPAMAGKLGSIVGPVVGGNFAVQFESGSIFNFAPENMQDAAAPMPTNLTPINVAQLTELSFGEDEEEELPIGTGVVVVGGHAMAQRRGTVVEHPAGDSFAVAVRFESGSVFYIAKSSVRCMEMA